MILIMFAASAFAGEGWNSNRRMAVTIGISPILLLDFGLSINIGFEYALTPHASIISNFRYFILDRGSGFGNTPRNLLFLGGSRWAFTLGGRWYPQGNYVHGWFFSGAIQFWMDAGSSLLVDNEESSYNTWRQALLSIYAGSGYKAFFGNGRRAVFVIEPTVDFGVLIFDSESMDSVPNVWDGWLFGISGLRFRSPIGVAF